jgi:hypothetical protein
MVSERLRVSGQTFSPYCWQTFNLTFTLQRANCHSNCNEIFFTHDETLLSRLQVSYRRFTWWAEVLRLTDSQSYWRKAGLPCMVASA